MNKNRTRHHRAQWGRLLRPDISGTYRIVSCSGLALDVSGGSGSNRANIQIYTPNGTRAQKWIFKTAA